MTVDVIRLYEAPYCEVLHVSVESAFVSAVSTQTESYDHQIVDPEFE